MKNLFRLVVVAHVILRSRGGSAASPTISRSVSNNKAASLGSHNGEETGKAFRKEGSYYLEGTKKCPHRGCSGSLCSWRECSLTSVHSSSASHHAHASPFLPFACQERGSQVTAGEERRNGPEYIREGASGLSDL